MPAHLDPPPPPPHPSGYGQTGPDARLPGYASVCEAGSGFRSVNGFADRPPARPNISLGDSLAGLHAAFGAVLALLARARGAQGGGGEGARGQGLGQVVDVAITESMLSMMEAALPEAADAGIVRGPSGSTISGVVPSGTFLCADGRYAVVGGNGDSVFARLAAAIGRDDLQRYATNAERVEAADEIYGAIEEWCAARPLASVLAAAAAARVPAGPILTAADLLASPQLAARGVLSRVAPPGGGDAVTLPSMFPLLTRTPGATAHAGPALGQHTDEVLAAAGFGGEEVARMRAAGEVA